MHVRRQKYCILFYLFSRLIGFDFVAFYFSHLNLPGVQYFCHSFFFTLIFLDNCRNDNYLNQNLNWQHMDLHKNQIYVNMNTFCEENPWKWFFSASSSLSSYVIQHSVTINFKISIIDIGYKLSMLKFFLTFCRKFIFNRRVLNFE